MSEACGRRAERRGGIDDVLGLAGHPYASVLVYVSIAVAGRTSSSVCMRAESRSIFFLSFTLESGISAPTCVRIWAGGESAFLLIAPLPYLPSRGVG
jgi:hypothetical protein